MPLPTPADYAALFARLEGPRDCAWPLIMRDSLAVEDALVDDDSDEAIAARAAWWTRLVAPRREAESDRKADGALNDATRSSQPPGWRRYMRVGSREVRWLPISDPANAMRPGEEREALILERGLTTRQLRARLAFVGATGVACEACSGGDGSTWGYRRSGAQLLFRGVCKECRGTGRILPEPVPQRDASHGARCWCEVTFTRDQGVRVMLTEPDLWRFTELQPEPVGSAVPRKARPRWCQFCAGQGIVCDGRRDGQHDYDACLTMEGRSIAGFYAANDAVRQSAISVELAHRREQPDAGGHPYEMTLATRDRRIAFANEMVDALDADPMREDGVFMGSQAAWDTLDSWAFECDETLARAPLAETLHGEREGYVATSGASRREPA